MHSGAELELSLALPTLSTRAASGGLVILPLPGELIWLHSRPFMGLRLLQDVALSFEKTR